MQTYLNALRKIRTEGIEKTDRTGTGTRSYFGIDMRFDISQSFPLVTTKKCHFKSIAYEKEYGSCKKHSFWYQAPCEKR